MVIMNLRSSKGVHLHFQSGRESEGRDYRHNGSVFANDEAATYRNTTAAVMTENHDSEDVHTFDRIVSRGIGNLSLENTQTIESEDDLRDDTSDLNIDDALRNTAAKKNFTQTEVGSATSNVRQSPT